MKTPKILTFGEVMLRLSPPGYNRFLQNDQFQATFGGAEANVAVSLASFGLASTYVTRLPENPIADGCIASLRSFGVDTSAIVRGGERIGIYYLEKGASQRPSVCVYDRAHSAIQTASPSDFDWDTLFEGVDWFHFTGITPALCDTLADICETALRTAKQKGVTVSCDTNFRSKLWTLDKAKTVMARLWPYVDVCFTNPGDAKDLFGVLSDKPDFVIGKPDKEGCLSIAEKLVKQFGFSRVALTMRHNASASDNEWAGMLYDGNNAWFSRQYKLHIVDRVGGGDSFSAGLIYSLLTGKDGQSAIDFAVAAAALKHSIENDFNRVTVDEVERLAGGDGSGRVQR